MVCNNCGKPIPGGVKFCPACGAAQPAPGAQTAPATQTAPPQAPAREKPVGLLLLAVVLAALLVGSLVIAPNAGNPCEKAERRFYRLNSFEDIIRKGPDIGDLLLGMAQADIDMTVFEGVDGNGPDYYALAVDHWYIQEKDINLSMDCEEGRVVRVAIDIMGGGLRGPEMTELKDAAISAYGTNYEQREWADFHHYTWPGTDLLFMTFNDGTGVVTFTFTEE